MKRVRNIMLLIMLILSHAGCIVVASQYQHMVCGIQHQGFSAPAEVAFLYAIPFTSGIFVCGLIALVCHIFAKAKEAGATTLRSVTCPLCHLTFNTDEPSEDKTIIMCPRCDRPITIHKEQ